MYVAESQLMKYSKQTIPRPPLPPFPHPYRPHLKYCLRKLNSIFKFAPYVFCTTLSFSYWEGKKEKNNFVHPVIFGTRKKACHCDPPPPPFSQQYLSSPHTDLSSDVTGQQDSWAVAAAFPQQAVSCRAAASWLSSPLPLSGPVGDVLPSRGWITPCDSCKMSCTPSVVLAVAVMCKINHAFGIREKIRT